MVDFRGNLLFKCVLFDYIIKNLVILISDVDKIILKYEMFLYVLYCLILKNCVISIFNLFLMCINWVNFGKYVY